MSNILVAEDESDLREFLREELSEAGFNVTAVSNGADAVIAATENKIDLFLLDMLMPGLDGIQTIKVLRKIMPHTPIIGLTGYVGQGYMAEASTYNVTCLSKPIKIDDLVAEIRQEL